MSETTPPASREHLLPIEHRRRRALFRANHRGTKELDWLIGRYAQARVPAMDEAEMDVFEPFLAVPDPDLHAWIMDPARLDQNAFRPIVADLRKFHRLAT